MKTDNELIAEFMGIKVAPYTHYAVGDMIAVVPEEGCIDWPTLTEYCPDKSWDWLMPVVEKINKQWESFANEHTIDPNNVSAMPDALIRIRLNLPRVDIFVVHKAVVEFIKWYKWQRVKTGILNLILLKYRQDKNQSIMFGFIG